MFYIINLGKKSVNLNNLITVWRTILSSLLKTFQKTFHFLLDIENEQTPKNTRISILYKIFQKTLKNTKIKISYLKRYDKRTYM